jgi:predicted AAA+ superfamily ATPase
MGVILAMIRYNQQFIAKDLQKKMVFIGGPRQVGKTTLSQNLIATQIKPGQYFNWDIDEDRKAILHKQWRKDSKLIIFDELHKYPKWKQWIKGVYDSKISGQQYLVTGSARLDIYRQGGDSLMGRYHYWRLHPFTIDEYPNNISHTEAYERLLKFGGFPEPFMMADEREVRRWRRERFDRILREDIRDLEYIREIQLLYLYVEALRERAGGLITFANIAQGLQISPKTAKSWLGLLERMYIVFPVYPFTASLPRAIQKPPKIYFYDNADTVDNPAVRLENLVATTLIKRLNFLEDYYGYRCQLHYLRDKDGREVDFVTVIDNQIEDLIEVKLSDKNISNSLRYYTEKLKPKRAIQLVGKLSRSFDDGQIQVVSPLEFFSKPPWYKVNSASQ